MPVPRDMTKYHEMLTMNGQIQKTEDVIQWLIDNNPGVPDISFGELAERGIVRANDSEGIMYGPGSPYGHENRPLAAWKRAVSDFDRKAAVLY